MCANDTATLADALVLHTPHAPIPCCARPLVAAPQLVVSSPFVLDHTLREKEIEVAYTRVLAKARAPEVSEQERIKEDMDSRKRKRKIC